MKLLVFEFAAATGLKNPSLTAEGKAMLESILDDLKEFEPQYLVHKNSNHFSTDAEPVPIVEDLYSWLNENIDEYDACLPIAPEESNILRDLTSIIEQKGVDVLGSSSNALDLTTNKFDMYNALKGKVPVIKTEKLFLENDLEDTEYNTRFKQGVYKVLKPV